MEKEEEYFPRGGAKGQQKNIKSDRTYIFQSKKLQKIPKKKPGRKERLRESAKKDSLIEDEQSEHELNKSDIFNIPEPFTIKSVKEGTLSICSITGIFCTHLTVELPERLSAYVPISLISQPLKKLIDENSKVPALTTYFSIGHHLTCRVTEVKNKSNNNHVQITATTDPSQINSNVPFNFVSKGYTLIAAVESCEDHGYIMQTGITRLNAFLPRNEAESFIVLTGKQIGIGQLLWCKVEKCTVSETCNLVQLTVNPEKVSSSKLKTVASPDVLIPGVQVNVAIEKTSKLLFVRELSSGERGYISRSHLEDVWSKVSDYQIGTEYSATVLYKFPNVDIVCYSMKIKPNDVVLPEIKNGTILKRAQIIGKTPRDIFVQLEYNDKKYKGVISMNKLRQSINEEELDELFPVNNHITVRIINYYHINNVYSCTTADDQLQKGGHISDYKVGQLVDVKINSIAKTGLHGIIGVVHAFIPFRHINDNVVKEPTKNIKVNQTYNGRIFSIDENRNSVVVTLCPGLVKNKPLKDFKKVKQGQECFGLVYKLLNTAVVISFFNNLTAVIQETELIKAPAKYKIGELIRCHVVKIIPDKKPMFSETKPLDGLSLKIGYEYPIVVKNISEKGFDCLVLESDKPLVCSLPVEHLSDSFKFCPILFKNYKIYDEIRNAILYTFDGEKPIFTLRYSVKKFFEDNNNIKLEGISALKAGDELPATISKIINNEMLLDVPLPGYNGKLTVKLPKTLKGKLKVNQGINVVIQKINTHARKVIGSCQKVTEITLFKKELNSFLMELSKHIKHKPGDVIKAEIIALTDVNIKVLLPDKSIGIIEKITDNKQFKKGEKVKTIFLYEDLLENVSHLCYKSKDLNKGDQNSTFKIVHLNTDFCIGFDPATSNVIFLNPVNDNLLINRRKILSSPVHVQGIRSCGIFKLGTVHWKHLITNMLSSTVDMKDKEERDVKKGKNKQNKLEVSVNSDSEDDEEEHDESMSEDDENVELTSGDNDSSDLEEKNRKLKNLKEKNKERKSIKETLEPTKKKKRNENSESNEEMNSGNSKKNKSNDSFSNEKNKENKFKLTIKANESGAAKALKQRKLTLLENMSLEGVGDFKWDATPEDLARTVAMGKMDYVEEDSEEEVVMKKKKLTPAEKKTAQIEAERIIREKEEELLRCEENPQSSDHFDRLLSAKPNDSKLWIQYMAFHLQGTDIDKARAIAKRALSQINVREEQERLNVWLALLNLENTYGSSESFENTHSEALKYNDDYQVYIKTLGMYCESQKVAELDKLTNYLVRKYKNKIDCWLECQSALMRIGLTDKARNYLQRSLTSIPKKEHLTLISRFALMENKHGFHEQAQSLFENLLTSYPQRIDIWNVYVDMLVKSDSIDLARTVLERIPSHKLPVRKMRAIYKKWLQFEEKYGNEKSVENVRKAAEEYITDVLLPNEKKLDKVNDDDSDEENNISQKNVEENSDVEEDSDDDDDDASNDE